MKLFRLLFIAIAIAMFASCAFIPVFQNTAETELTALASALTDTRLEDLFRQDPTLKLVKSTDIGNENTRHEFSYLVVEDEDTSKRTAFSNDSYIYERRTTFYINIFVNSEGVIYEVLEPVRGESDIVATSRNIRASTK